MGTFSTSLSGLDAEEQALSVISNDLSNLNTTAFKSGTPVFSDLFLSDARHRRGRRPGASRSWRHHEFGLFPDDPGTITTTGVPTDVAIQGNGLFVLDQGSTQVYSRAGNFLTNTQGNLVDSNGNNVMGYSAVNGVINTSQALAPIVISSGQTYPSQRHLHRATGYEPRCHGHDSRAGNGDPHGATAPPDAGPDRFHWRDHLHLCSRTSPPRARPSRF